jgi:hypothetical protein
MAKKGSVDESRIAGLNLRLLSYAAAPAVALLGAGAAQAGVIDFTGSYAVGNWSIANGSGSIDTSLAPSQVTVVGGANGSNSATNEDFYITVLQAGTWNFDWSYDSSDCCNYDQAYYLLNSSSIFLSQNNPYPTTSGHVSTPVGAGDTIGWRVYSLDNLYGAGYLTINNFSISDGSVPEPSSVSLMALGAAGLLFFRRRRAKA